MVRKALVTGMVFGLGLLTAVAAEPPAVQGKLTAAQIVDRNVAARGGLQAWRGVQSFEETGMMAAGGNDRTTQAVEIPGAKRPGKAMPLPTSPRLKEEAQLPFVLDLERPRKMRLEIQFAGKTAVQVYDGTNGWKLRPYLNRNDVEPFTAEEIKTESQWPGIDGPLVDFAAKRTKVEFAGVEPVDGHAAYKLKLTLKDGTIQHIWIDARSFLDVKMEGTPRRMDGRMHTVWIYQRDFRAVQGLMIPFEIETAVDGYRETHKMVIEKAMVNPSLADSHFGKPGGV